MASGDFDRDQALDRLRTTDFDVVVIGGGITGAGVALDAASRGLRTALVERDDFASGTSSRSSKLVHGGLRYLQQGDIKLVYQALAERQRLRRNAPHLVRILPFLLPVFSRDGLFDRKLAWALGKAMWMYDLTGGARIGKLHQRLSTDDVIGYMPTLPADRLVGGYLYYDAATDDARLTLAVARTAAVDHGAVIVNRAGVIDMTRRDDGTLSGVRVSAELDDGTREEIEVSASVVVSATGVWADQVRGLGQDTAPATIRPAKGIHITVPWDLVRNEIAVVIPVPKDRRSVFVVPWGDQTYIGTTDTDYDGPIDDPQCTPDDVAYLLRAINASVEGEITEDDITGTWAGLRPLVRATGSGRTADLSRMHRVQVDDDGLVTISGGKLTTYRDMAEDTVDAVLESLGDRVTGRVHRSARTKDLPLRGARAYSEVCDQAEELAAVAGLAEADVMHLADRYGGEARVLLAMIEHSPELRDRLAEGHPYLRAEVVHAVRYEMARDLDDILARRIPLRLRDANAAMSVAADVAALMAPELGWSEEEAARRTEAFRRSVTEERSAAALPVTRAGAESTPLAEVES